jgi:hypothetical protein
MGWYWTRPGGGQCACVGGSRRRCSSVCVSGSVWSGPQGPLGCLSGGRGRALLHLLLLLLVILCEGPVCLVTTASCVSVNRLIDVPCCLLCGQVGHLVPGAATAPGPDDSSGSIPCATSCAALRSPQYLRVACMRTAGHDLAYLTERRQAVGCDGVASGAMPGWPVERCQSPRG